MTFFPLPSTAFFPFPFAAFLLIFDLIPEPAFLAVGLAPALATLLAFLSFFIFCCLIFFSFSDRPLLVPLWICFKDFFDNFEDFFVEEAAWGEAGTGIFAIRAARGTSSESESESALAGMTLGFFAAGVPSDDLAATSFANGTSSEEELDILPYQPTSAPPRALLLNPGAGPPFHHLIGKKTFPVAGSWCPSN